MYVHFVAANPEHAMYNQISVSTTPTYTFLYSKSVKKNLYEISIINFKFTLQKNIWARSKTTSSFFQVSSIWVEGRRKKPGLARPGYPACVESGVAGKHP